MKAHRVQIQPCSTAAFARWRGLTAVLLRPLTRLARDDTGGIVVMMALTSTLLIGFVGLAIDVGVWYRAQRALQNAADSAAVAAALNGGAVGATGTATAEAEGVAANYGYSNTANISVTQPSSCPNQSSGCYQVTITATAPQFFSKVLGVTAPTLSASAEAGTVTGSGSPASADACIIALSTSGTGITLEGGTSVSAPGCSVATNQTFHQANCGPTITTATAGYDSGTPPFNSTRCSAMLVPPSGTSSVKTVKQLTADPLAGTSGVTTATSRLTTVEAIASPSGPSNSSGSNISFAYSPSSFSQGGCNFTLSGSTWTGTCSGTGPFSFGNVTLSGGITVNFNTSGSASATYNFNQITNSGTALHFGSGTFNIAQGINISGGGSATSFGSGTFNIGAIPSASSCSGPPSTSTNFSVCMNGTSLTFGGPSTFVLAGGIYNKGGETLTMGSGTSNSFNIGKATDGYSIYVGGGSTTTFADATGSGDEFQTAGSIASSGGSCLTLSAASQHDINGFIQLSGGLTMGAGVYTVSQYFDIGGSSGGDVSCNGSSVGVYGNNVTVVIGGTASDPNCSGDVFCIGSGFGHVTFVAPTSGTTANLAIIGPASSSNTYGALLTQGSTNTSVSGALYLPHGAISLSGGAELGSGSGCLELIGSEITLSGGSALGTTCSGIGQVAVGGSVALVK